MRKLAVWPIGLRGLGRLSPFLTTVDLQQDQVLFIPLCANCVKEIEALGRLTEAADARDVVMVV